MLNIPEYPTAAAVFAFFEEISRIPRPSGHTAAIADHLVAFAKERGLYCRRDGHDNVLIRKPATPGYESRPTVILQGHIDMVAEKLPGLAKDMTQEGVELYRDGDFLRARGTTLGADDGVAIAYTMAILDSHTIPHPELEVLLTSDEEIGLLGAAALDVSDIRGRILINIDSDGEGIFTVGCAGGVRADILLPVERTQKTAPTWCLTVTGLRGGHSGAEIDKGRVNAVKLTAELLSRLPGAIPIAITGGNMDNAIPRECTAILMTADDPTAAIHDLQTEYRARYAACEPELTITVERQPASLPPLTAEATDRLLRMLNEMPCGVMAMSRALPDLVETSLNLGIIRTEEEAIAVTYSLRSSENEEKQRLLDRLTAIAAHYGATVSTRGDYPGWSYRTDSRLQRTACRVFRERYSREATVVTIHAGLECGIFAEKLPGLDCLSLGPDNYDIHTTEERLSLSSTVRVYDFLLHLLKEL